MPNPVLTILFALLTLSAGLWAVDDIKYIDADGVEQTANNVTVITPTTTTLTEGWYFVIQANTSTLVCTGAVHLILFDAAKLTATGSDKQPGIQVSGDGNSLTIYGQNNQTGQLIANGGNSAAGIGSGDQGSAASNIFVATTHIVKADGNNPPTTVIAPTRTDGTDIASDLASKRYVTVQLDLTPYKTAAIDEIDAAIEGVTDEYITTIAANAKTNITNAKTIGVINFVKTLAIAKINAIKEINDAIKDLTLFSAEESYIDFIKSSIQQGNDVNLINGDKQLGLDYIALHDDKLAAIAAVKHDMGDYAESEAIYNFIGGPAIEAAVDADKITEVKNAALAKLEEFSEVLGEASIAGYNKGKEDGIEEALGEMGTPCEDCPSIEVTKGDKTIKLYNPDKVEFKKE